VRAGKGSGFVFRFVLQSAVAIVVQVTRSEPTA
jgi:hypothetical protein